MWVEIVSMLGFICVIIILIACFLGLIYISVSAFKDGETETGIFIIILIVVMITTMVFTGLAVLEMAGVL
jgi:hypothetical protein